MGGPRQGKYSTADKRQYWGFRQGGMNVGQAAKKIGCSYRTAMYWESGDDPNVRKIKEQLAQDTLPNAMAVKDLGANALRALDDFEFMRAHYLGHVSTPWQIEAAYTLVELLASPDKEYVVLNTPPGVGKSTLFTHDILIWLIIRDRSVRIILGSRTQRQAERYSMRIRRTLERTMPVRPPSEDIAKGLACDGEGILGEDFGRFKPTLADLWRVEEFVVAQQGDALLEDKEPTVAAYGMDSGFLGNRGDLVIWDDLVDRKVLKTGESIASQRKWWDEEAETRLEPGGLLGLVGQRMGSQDLYRYCLDMEAADPYDDIDAKDDDEEADGAVRDTLPRKYRHIIYKAHYPELCKKIHKPSRAKPWPEGCLLDTRRLGWRELGAVLKNRPETFRVQYQQEDVDPAQVLVPRVYIDGGRDPEDGTECPGCWDEDRSLVQVPEGLSPPFYSIATADPSPTKFWAIEWWIYHPASQQRFLVDLLRQSMDAPDFLDWNQNNAQFYGVMQDWQVRSRMMNAPISHWVVEINAAQRFLLQFDHVHRWTRLHGVKIVPHNTTLNKIKDDYGIQMLKNPYRFGQYRLPGARNSKNIVLKLVEELTHYPDTPYSDCMMANWFFESNLKSIVRPDKSNLKLPSRPSWLSPARMRVGVNA